MIRAGDQTWSGGKGAEKAYQNVINRMGRATLGIFGSAPLGIVAAESGLTPARALLNYRQASFSRRLYSRPQGGGGPEEILERRSSALTTRIRATAALHATRPWSLSGGAPGTALPGRSSLRDGRRPSSRPFSIEQPTPSGHTDRGLMTRG